jgi:hypothetical protein
MDKVAPVRLYVAPVGLDNTIAHVMVSPFTTVGLKLSDINRILQRIIALLKAIIDSPIFRSFEDYQSLTVAALGSITKVV